MNSLVSVIIPNYNYSRFLSETIESVLGQTYKDLEIIVVDDGSTDGSLELLEGFGDKITVVQQVNAGVAAARNRGVAKSSGDLIAFLDADDVWLRDKITKQVERFAHRPQSGLIHVGVQDIDGDGQPLGQHSDGMQGDVSGELLLFERSVILGGGSGIMLPRIAFDSVGGFDIKLSTSADWDLFYRISYRYPTEFIPEILLKYRFHNSNMHGNIAQMEKEMTIGFKKAFDTDDPKVLAMKRHATGNLHRVLAGSYFQCGDYLSFVKEAVKSLTNRPQNLAYFAEYPFRRFSRRTKRDVVIKNVA